MRLDMNAVATPAETRAFRFFSRTKDVWDAMYEDCQAARDYIQIEQYIFYDDAAGHRFFELFSRKAAEGVRIRLMVDSVGSVGLDSSPQIKRIHEMGGEIRFYNPVSVWHIFRPSKIYPRSHTKLLLIDDAVAYVGSACIDERMQGWTDVHARLSGRIAQSIRKLLETSLFSRPSAAPEKPKDPFHYVLSVPQFGQNPVYRELLRAIHSASDSICLVTPYFLPPWRLRRALYRAVRRGVHVRIMVSETTDARIADLVTRSYLKILLKHGLEIWMFKPFMLHAKYTVVDGDWATIGSTNLDYLSLRHNREGNLIVYDRDAVAELRNIFDLHIKDCFRVDEAYCESIPWYEKILGFLGRSIKRVL